jgi:hypothetical protein
VQQLWLLLLLLQGMQPKPLLYQTKVLMRVLLQCLQSKLLCTL